MRKHLSPSADIDTPTETPKDQQTKRPEDRETNDLRPTTTKSAAATSDFTRNQKSRYFEFWGLGKVLLA